MIESVNDVKDYLEASIQSYCDHDAVDSDWQAGFLDAAIALYSEIPGHDEALIDRANAQIEEFSADMARREDNLDVPNRYS